MTIHSEHPFLPPESDRDPVRRLRGRMPQPVTVWCAQRGDARAGWTVSSLVLADGEPAEVAGLIDEDSDLADLAEATRTVAISVLAPTHRGLADALAGIAPAPGGAFRMGTWRETTWGPVLTDAVGWLGVELTDTESRLGWARLFRGWCAEVSLDPEAGEVLAHLRGRYRALPLR